jgi:cytosine/adenosine deaminase-related metal-dependent hydrolase
MKVPGMFLLSLLCCLPVQAQAVAFVDVNVVPMDSATPRTPDVIVALGPSNTAKVPDGTQRIDDGGKYLMPGLADMHAHLDVDFGGTIRAYLFLFVANGVTTYNSRQKFEP